MPGQMIIRPYRFVTGLFGRNIFHLISHYRASKSIILQQKMKTIGICSDHAGFELKQYIKGWLETKGWEYKDFGTYTTESCDYADFAHPLALAGPPRRVLPVIAISRNCGEGIGISTEQTSGYWCRFAGLPEIAHLVRQHNDANVLVMPQTQPTHE